MVTVAAASFVEKTLKRFAEHAHKNDSSYINTYHYEGAPQEPGEDGRKFDSKDEFLAHINSTPEPAALEESAAVDADPAYKEQVEQRLVALESSYAALKAQVKQLLAPPVPAPPQQ